MYSTTSSSGQKLPLEFHEAGYPVVQNLLWPYLERMRKVVAAGHILLFKPEGFTAAIRVLIDEWPPRYQVDGEEAYGVR
jgi:hypothetical protein